MLKINSEIDLEWLMNKFGLRYCPHDKKSVKKQGFPSCDYYKFKYDKEV